MTTLRTFFTALLLVFALGTLGHPVPSAVAAPQHGSTVKQSQGDKVPALLNLIKLQRHFTHQGLDDELRTPNYGLVFEAKIAPAPAFCRGFRQQKPPGCDWALNIADSPGFVAGGRLTHNLDRFAAWRS